MEGLEQLDMVGDISPALEATEEFIHCMGGMQGQGPSQAQTGTLQPKQLQEGSSAARGKLSSSGVWGLLAREQTEVGPLGLAWADNFTVLGLGVGLRHGKRSRARSTNDLAAQSKECTHNTANSSSNSAFKKGHNRSRSDVNYRPSVYTDNGLATVDCNTLKNMILNHQPEGEFTHCDIMKKVAFMNMFFFRFPKIRICGLYSLECTLALPIVKNLISKQIETSF